MPLFEYRCSECEELVEVLEGANDEPLEDCRKCGSTSSMEKIVSLSSFALKGGGWYKDGYSKVSRNE